MNGSKSYLTPNAHPLPKWALLLTGKPQANSIPNYAEKHQGISFGAIIFDIETFEPVETLYSEVKFRDDKYLWDDAAVMHKDGYKFKRSANGVWLTKNVPPKYLKS